MNRKKNKKFLKKPEYPGGTTAMRKFINENLKYPKEAVENRIEGAVVVNFDIDYRGEVANVVVAHGIGYGCDEEAIRLVKKMKFSKAINRGIIVKVSRRIRINFNLNTQSVEINYIQTKNKGNENISYEYIPTEKKQPTNSDNKSQKESKKYTYTISW